MIKLTLLMLAALSASARPADPAIRKLRIFSATGWSLGVNFDTDGALERLLKEDPEHVRVERLDYELLYFSDGHYLLDLPKGIAKDQLPAGVPVPQADVEILEGQRSILLVEPAVDYPLLDKLLKFTQEGRNDDTYRPSVRRKTARLETIPGKTGVFRALAVGARPPSGTWGWTFAMRYDLLVDGKKVRATLLGKPYGGFSSVLPALERRRKELKEPALLVNLGAVGLPGKYGLDAQTVLKLMLDAGLRITAFAGHDLENSWDALLKSASEGPEEKRAVLLASNLKASDPAAANPLRRFHVETVDGVKVGFLSVLSRTSDVILARKGLPWTVEDPIAAAREAVADLRFGERVDLVVAVSHLSTAEDALLNQVPGIDLVLGDSSGETAIRRRTVVELTDWSRENHYKPVLEARPSYFTYGEIAAEFRPAGGKWELTRVEEVPSAVDPYLTRDPAMAALEERIYGFFDVLRRPVLPDPRGLWPLTKKPKMTYASSEFWNVAAQILRRKTGAEVALLRVSWLNSNAAGEVTESFASTWFDSPERLVRFRLDGASLRALLPRVLYEKSPDVDESRRRYETEVWLAQAGLDEKGLVHGLPIRDDEFYQVVTTEDVMRKTDALPALKAARDARTEKETLDQAVLPWLIERHAAAAVSTGTRAAYEEEVRAMAEGATPERPVWRLHLRELSAQFSNTQLHNEGPFNQVKDARIQSVSQVQGQGTARLFSEYYRRRWRWDVGATARYGKVILRQREAPPLENKTQDQFLLETELRHQTWRFERRARGYSAGPFVNASYDTEFTPPVAPGVPIRRFFSLKPGMKVFEGARLKDLRAAAVIQTDYSTPQRKTVYGFETGFEWLGSLPRSKATLQAKATYLQFAPNRLDTLSDLRRQLELSAKLGVPVVGNLKLSPFADFFLFDSKLLPQRGYNLVFGVSLEFSQLWKPVY